MKKYNFVNEPPDDPFEVDGGPGGGLSPAAKRLLIIGIVGIVLGGGLYVYLTYFAEAPGVPGRPLAVREKPIQRPVAPPPSTQPQARPEPFRPAQVREEPLTSPQVRQEPLKPSVQPPVAKQEAQGPPPVQAKAEKSTSPVQPPQEATAQTGDQGVKPPRETQAKTEKPTPLAHAKVEKAFPQQGARAEKPSPEPQAKVEKPAPQAMAKVPTTPGTVERQYAIQVASLVREQNALSLQKRLEKMGYTPDVRKVTARITQHRVYVGEFNSREEAGRTARQLNVDGFPSNVVAIKGGKFALEAGSFLRLNEAIDLARNLQTKNYTAKIVSDPVPTAVHQVRVGKYGNRAEALKALDSLKRKGFEPLVVTR